MDFGCNDTVVEFTMNDSHYLADVFGLSDYFKGLAIEVFVTHETEEDKYHYFHSNEIPFLEVIPSYISEGNIQFALHSYSFPTFFDDYVKKVDNNLISHLYLNYGKKLGNKVKNQSGEEQILIIKLNAVKALKKDILNDTNSNFYRNLQSSLYDVNTNTKVISNMAHITKKEQLTDIQYSSRFHSKKSI